MNRTEFPGATTPWQSVPRKIAGAWEQSNAVAADAEARKIAQRIVDMRKEGDGLANDAQTVIEDCAAFSVAVEAVRYVPPGFNPAHLVTVESTAAWPALADLPARTLEPPRLEGAATLAPWAPSPALERPAAQAVETPASLDAAPLPAAPALPQDLEIAIPAVPSVEIAARDIPLPPDLGPVPVPTDLPTPARALAPRLPEIDAAPVGAALDRLRSVLDQRPAVPAYASVVPSAFALVGALIAGPSPAMREAVALARERSGAIDSRHAHLLGAAFSRRGLASEIEPHLGAFIQRERERREVQRDANDAATLVLAADDAIRDALRIGAAAYAQAAELRIALAESELDALMAQAEAQAELWTGVLTAYQGAAAAWESRAQTHDLGLALEEARADAYAAEIAAECARADFNAAANRAFVASERAKTAAVELSAADLDGEQAKLRAFRAANQAVAARAEALGAGVERYRARVAAWLGEAETVRADWKRYAARARGAVAGNRAEAARVAASGADNQTVAAMAQRVAAEVAAQSDRLRIAIELRKAELGLTDLVNAETAASVAQEADRYATRLARAVQPVVAAQANLEGRASEHQAQARFFAAATEAAGRAAELTQNANIQLAEAYATAQEAAGRAAAAVEAGRFGGYSASVTLAAGADLDAAQNWTRSISEGYHQSVSESDAKSERATS